MTVSLLRRVSYDFCIFELMDVLTTIGVISSFLGIYSFVKNDTSLLTTLKKRSICHNTNMTGLKKNRFTTQKLPRNNYC